MNSADVARMRAAVVLMLLCLPLGHCRDSEGPKVSGLAFEGVEALDEKDLRDVLATRSSSMWPWGEEHAFDSELFEADLERVVAFYNSRGFPHARVASFRVDPNPADRSVALTIVVEEGRPDVVDEVRLEGFEVLSPGDLDRLHDTQPLEPGDRLAVREAQEALQVMLDTLREEGYAYAKVGVTDTAVGPEEEGRHLVTFTATPGTRAVFGPVAITGNESVSDTTVRRQVMYRPGQLFRQSLLRQTQRRLFGLELFEFVNVERIDSEAQPVEVPTRVTLVEGDHRRVELRAGYGTEEMFRVGGDLRHVNFLGSARTARLRGKWSSLDRGAEINFDEPFLFHRRLSLGLTGRRWFLDEPAYKLDTLAGSATLRYHLGGGTTADGTDSTAALLTYSRSQEAFSIANDVLANLGLRDELIALRLDPRTGAGRGTLSSLGLEVQRNTVGNLLDAKEGYLASVEVEQGGWWLTGDFRYVEAVMQARHYQPLGDDGDHVWANRIRFGSIHGPGTTAGGLESSAVPFFKRYFLGGSTSLRGWGRLEVSPLSASGLPLGGLTMLEATSELRLALTGKFSAVVFVDAGNVWPNSWDVNPGDLRYAVGPGLRYDTVIGPVRADFGYQLTPIEGLLVDGVPEARRWRIHLSIGQAF